MMYILHYGWLCLQQLFDLRSLNVGKEGLKTNSSILTFEQKEVELYFCVNMCTMATMVLCIINSFADISM